jgi:hypothetical protein
MKNPISINRIKTKAAPDPTAIPAISPLLRSGLLELVKSEEEEGDKVVEAERDEARKAVDIVAPVFWLPVDVLLNDVPLVNVMPEQALPLQHLSPAQR